MVKAKKHSERGKAKRAARTESNARIILDRLIEKYPDRARLARDNEQLVRWFAAKTMEILDRTPALEAMETLAKIRIEAGPRDSKYLHAHAKKNLQQSTLKEAA